MEVLHQQVTLAGAVLGSHDQVTLTGLVQAAPRDPLYQPILLGSVSGSLCRALALPLRVYRWVVRVDGVELPASALLYPIVVRQQRQGLHTWSLTVALSPDGTSPLGRLAAGVEGFCREVEIAVSIHTDSGAVEAPLLARSRVESVRERRDPPSIELSGMGYGGRFAQATAGIQIPRGSLRARGEVATEMLLAAGWDPGDVAIAPGRTMVKLINAEAEQPGRLIDDLLLPELRALYHDPITGGMTTAPLGPLPGLPTAISASRILEDGASAPSAGEITSGPTAILVITTRQLTDGDCSAQTSETVVEILQDVPRPKAVARYASDGTVVLLGGPATTGQNLVSRTVIRETSRCGEVVYRRTGVSEWFKGPEAWKASLATDGTVSAVNTLAFCYELPGPTPVGGASVDPVPMYRDSAAHFLEVRVTHEYFDYSDGVLQSQRTHVDAWRNTRKALKHKLPAEASTPWEEIPYIDGVRVLANGHGTDGSEGLLTFAGSQPGAERSAEYLTHKGARVVSRRREQLGWVLAPGGAFWFGEGEVSQFDAERFGFVRIETESLSEAGSQHRATTLTEVPARPDDPEHGQVQTEFRRGGLPASPILEEPGPGEVAAPADSTQEMEWTYDLQIDPACRLPRVQRVEVQYAETLADLQAVAEHLGRQALSLEDSVEVLLDPTLGPLTPIEVIDKPFVRHVVHPDEVEHRQQSADTPPTTRIVGRVYPS